MQFGNIEWIWRLPWCSVRSVIERHKLHPSHGPPKNCGICRIATWIGLQSLWRLEEHAQRQYNYVRKELVPFDCRNSKCVRRQLSNTLIIYMEARADYNRRNACLLSASFRLFILFAEVRVYEMPYHPSPSCSFRMCANDIDDERPWAFVQVAMQMAFTHWSRTRLNNSQTQNTEILARCWCEYQSILFGMHNRVILHWKKVWMASCVSANKMPYDTAVTIAGKFVNMREQFWLDLELVTTPDHR